MEVKEMERCGKRKWKQLIKKAGRNKNGVEWRKNERGLTAKEERQGGKETRGEGGKRSLKRRLGSEGTTQALS